MTRPRLMITTRSVTWLTSGRMCVDRSTVCSPRRRRDQIADLDALFRIEARGRLVEDEDRRLVHDRLGQADALLEPFRQRGDALACDVAEIGAVHGAVHAAAPSRAGDVLDLRDELEELTDGELGIERAGSPADSRAAAWRGSVPRSIVDPSMATDSRRWGAGSRSPSASSSSCRRHSGRGSRAPRLARPRRRGHRRRYRSRSAWTGVER